MCVQPIVDVSPTKWHLAHTTWFFENFILVNFLKGYKVFDKDYCYLFNSYYNSVGDRVMRFNRGNMTRPSIEKVFDYRRYVNHHINNLFEYGEQPEWLSLVELGINHEQQHQELLITDIKYILGNNPLFPAFHEFKNINSNIDLRLNFLPVSEGVYSIGHSDENAFCFDNEKGDHKVFLHGFQVSNRLITNGEYIEFINENGYGDFRHWLADGWDWVNENKVTAPLYWKFVEGEWFTYDLSGFIKINPDEPVTHTSFYEADAFARWRGKRLPTEFEWEVASNQYCQKEVADNFLDAGFLKPLRSSGEIQLTGEAWQWTNSAYLPYPFYKMAKGAIGEYNGKFMVNQMVLRGGSCATPKNHYRNTYRNFFQPDKRWQFTGIRLAEHI
jgi:ergothioneine biosynthesis protein EgtB